MAFARLQPPRRWTDRPQTPIGTPVGEFWVAALAISVGVALLSVAMAGGSALTLALPVLAFGAGAAIAARALVRSYPHARLGFCNAITLIRLGLAASLLAPITLGLAPSWGVLAVASLALALDGFDGWLARRQGYVSGFGARFDMEVDSALALILALGAVTSGAAGVLTLLLGLPRYLFGAAAWIIPWMGADLPDRFSRKIVCVLQLGVLIALQAPVLPPMAAALLVPLAAAALVWSFAVDVVWLWRRRP